MLFNKIRHFLGNDYYQTNYWISFITGKHVLILSLTRQFVWAKITGMARGGKLHNFTLNVENQYLPIVKIWDNNGESYASYSHFAGFCCEQGLNRS